MKPETSSCCSAPVTFYHVTNELFSLCICSNCGKRCNPKVADSRPLASELFEGENSSLYRTYQDATKPDWTPINMKNEPTLSLCDNCFCMTKNINGKCGKCKESKPMNEPQLSAEEVIKKDFPELAEAMAAHCITTTVPDEPNGQPLELWVMPIGQVVSWMRIANKQALATALEEQRASMIAEIEGWADENQMSPFANLGSTKYVRYAKLRAKLVEMKEGK